MEIVQNNEEIKALETVKTEFEKIVVKYQKKAVKEREKVNDVFVIVRGEKCYTEADINSWIEADYITAEQSDKYIEKLEKKKAAAGQRGTLTKSERICNILKNTILNISVEIKDIKQKQEQEQKRLERWEIAKAQGCTYQQWLDQEEVSRASEKYEKLMGK